jgi:hypothetical protein
MEYDNDKTPFFDQLNNIIAQFLIERLTINNRNDHEIPCIMSIGTNADDEVEKYFLFTSRLPVMTASIP